MDNLVECRDLRLGYGSHAMPPCPDFTVEAGDYLCIVGPNGSGKSTLLKAVAGLVKPLSGTLSLAPGLSGGRIGYVPQQGPLQRDFPASVREVVQSGCQSTRGWRPFYSRGEKLRARDAMERLGIAPLAGRCYRELSGGQRQRALLARAMCGGCHLLLMDWSIGMPSNAEMMTVAMVTHDRSGALESATHMLTLGPDASFERSARHG